MPDFGGELEAKTDAYLERLDDCVRLLPTLFEAYEDGEDYRETVERIQDLESECDEMNRALTGHLTSAGPSDMGILNTRINYNQSALIEFYGELDVVANLVERIAQELSMMQPSPETACFRDLVEMTEEVVAMTETLVEVVSRFVHELTATDPSETLSDPIWSIRNAETRCDELRNDVIAGAFADDEIVEPLMYREFAILVDEVANTIEDITDQIVIIASNEPDIVTDIDLSE